MGGTAPGVRVSRTHSTTGGETLLPLINALRMDWTKEQEGRVKTGPNAPRGNSIFSVSVIVLRSTLTSLCAMEITTC